MNKFLKALTENAPWAVVIGVGLYLGEVAKKRLPA